MDVTTEQHEALMAIESRMREKNAPMRGMSTGNLDLLAASLTGQAQALINDYECLAGWTLRAKATTRPGAEGWGVDVIVDIEATPPVEAVDVVVRHL